MMIRFVSVAALFVLAFDGVADAQIFRPPTGGKQRQTRTGRTVRPGGYRVTPPQAPNFGGFRRTPRFPQRTPAGKRKKYTIKKPAFPGPKGFQGNGSPKADKNADLAVGRIFANLKNNTTVKLSSFVMNVDSSSYSGSRKVRLRYKIQGGSWKGTPWVSVGNLASKKYKIVYVDAPYASLVGNGNVTYRVELTSGDNNSANDVQQFESALPPISPK